MTAAGSATLIRRCLRGDTDAPAQTAATHAGGAVALSATAQREDEARFGEAPPAAESRPARLPRGAVRLRFARFALIGLGNTAVTFAVFNLCTALLHLPAAGANVVGWIAGFANSFVWNRSWTFADRRHLRVGRVLPRFALASLVALGMSEGVLVGLHAVLLSWSVAERVPHTLLLNGVELVAIACSLGVSYALSAGWAFRKS
jgi:putative flippase GtrA